MKAVNQTRVNYAYHRTAVRHRGYNRRVLYPPRPRPGKPATAYFLFATSPYEIVGAAFDLPKYGLYFFNDNDASKYFAVKFADNPWEVFNQGIWFYPCPLSSDWQYTGLPGFWSRMTTPIPFGIQESFSWT